MTHLTKTLSLIALALAVAAPSAAKADTFITFVSSNGHRPRYVEPVRHDRHDRHEVRWDRRDRHEARWERRHDRHHWRHAHGRPAPRVVYVAPQPTWRVVDTGWRPSPAMQMQYRTVHNPYGTYR